MFVGHWSAVGRCPMMFPEVAFFVGAGHAGSSVTSPRRSRPLLIALALQQAKVPDFVKNLE